MSYYTSNKILCSYLLCNKKKSKPQVIIYCRFTQEKEYGYLIIRNSYLKIIPLSVECTCTQCKSKYNNKHTRTDNRT